MSTITSELFRLDNNDYVKGAIVFIISAVLTYVYPILAQHHLPNWKQTLYIAALAGISYLIKNFFTAPAIGTVSPV